MSSWLPRSTSDLKHAVQGVLKGLDWLHRFDYVHRDLRWDNVIQDMEENVRLIDLEHSRKEGRVQDDDILQHWPAMTYLKRWIFTVWSRWWMSTARWTSYCIHWQVGTRNVSQRCFEGFLVLRGILIEQLWFPALWWASSRRDHLFRDFVPQLPAISTYANRNW